MKKFMTLALAAGMVVSAAVSASAVDMKVSGSIDNTYNFADNLWGDGALLADKVEEGHFDTLLRARVNFDFIVDETLSGRMQIQAGEKAYGNGGNLELKARHLYVDWLVPNTDVHVRMGRQDFVLPSYTFGSSFLDEVLDGVSVHAPLNDVVAFNFGWARPNVDNEVGFNKPYEAHSSFDIAYIGADITTDAFAVSPWFMAGRAGSESLVGNDGVAGGMLGDSFALTDSAVMGYWAGIGAELTLFDPFKFTADFVYTANDADGAAERKGWYAAAGAEMATSFGTPFLRGWYASGEDSNPLDGSERAFDAIGGAFDASSIWFDANGLPNNPTIDTCSAAGTWGAQLGMKDVSFLEGLTHEFAVTYFEGTNDKVNYNMLTEKDSVVEVSALSTYEIYKNFSANLLLAYMITDFDKKVHAGIDDQNAFRGALNFNYGF